METPMMCRMRAGTPIASHVLLKPRCSAHTHHIPQRPGLVCTHVGGGVQTSSARREQLLTTCSSRAVCNRPGESAHTADGAQLDRTPPPTWSGVSCAPSTQLCQPPSPDAAGGRGRCPIWEEGSLMQEAAIHPQQLVVSPVNRGRWEQPGVPVGAGRVPTGLRRT